MARTAPATRKDLIEFTMEVETVLIRRGLSDLVPSNGLWHWIVQGWTEEDAARDTPEDAADLWIEQVDQSEDGD